ncbi:MAG TPA: hypothetical protein VN969_21430 [Streptosporangiaceae bacterium]|jgi:alkanesulfonate monooxygenase SsuD/methylene tetrahydromethanopterin reductase-like flavin-dependent oxidoreductase (luciferase family)|nr:hypothetical protein [Streptosporangiaceae bacterium]
MRVSRTCTDDRVAAAKELAARLHGAAPTDVARTPFVLIGTFQQMADQLHAQAREHGITRYVVREPAVPDLERVIPLLNKY